MQRFAAAHASLAQVARFGVVGVLATAIHVAVFVACIEYLEMRPLWANFPAFLLALTFGYAGHLGWTFHGAVEARGAAWMRAFIKFALVSGLGLLLNLLQVYTVVEVMRLPYAVSVLIMVSLVPAIVFVINKYWAFR